MLGKQLWTVVMHLLLPSEMTGQRPAVMVLVKHTYKNVLFWLMALSIPAIKCILEFWSLRCWSHISYQSQVLSKLKMAGKEIALCLSFIEGTSVLFSSLYCYFFFLHHCFPFCLLIYHFLGLSFNMYVNDNDNVWPLQKFEAKKKLFKICNFHKAAFLSNLCVPCFCLETLDIVYILHGVSLVNIFYIWFGLLYL